VDVVVEEVVPQRKTRRKDGFGNIVVSLASTRVRVLYNGKSYWVDADILDRP
jgi:hypothetical protein